MKTLRKGDHFEYEGVAGRITLQFFFKLVGWKVVCWGMWHRTGSSSGLLCMVLNVQDSHNARNVSNCEIFGILRGNLLWGVSYGLTDTKWCFSCKHNWSWWDSMCLKNWTSKG
jgi:hypothetical protein